MQGPIRSGLLMQLPSSGSPSQRPESPGTPRQTLLIFERFGMPEAVEQKPRFGEQLAAHKEPSLRNALTGLEESGQHLWLLWSLHWGWTTLRHEASKIQDPTLFPSTPQSSQSTGAENQRGLNAKQKARRRQVESHAPSSLFYQWRFHLQSLLTLASQSVVLGPAMAASSESLLDRGTLRPHPRIAESKSAF